MKKSKAKTSASTSTTASCCSGSCEPTSFISRRKFLSTAGLSAAGASLALVSLPRHPALAKPVAEPFVREDFLKLIPLDKKLDADWVASLTARGKPETFTGEALERIGMPVGGFFTGTLYLGGDGRLWYWDIFNNYREGLDGREGARNGANYVKPLLASNFRELEQGFTLTVKSGESEIRRTLDAEKATGFRDISFTGEYPIGVVRYSDPAMPVAVKLEAFSPFIPLNVKDSSLPVTIFSFKLTNNSNASVEATLEGVLENAVYHQNRGLPGTRRVTHVAMAGASVARLTAELDATRMRRGSEEIVFEDWSQSTFAAAGWRSERGAFGSGPMAKSGLPGYMGSVGGKSNAVANSHAGSGLNGSGDQQSQINQRDAATGKLISRNFTIDKNFICFEIAGGSNADKLGIRVVVDGKVVASVSGLNSNVLIDQSLDISDYLGQRAHLEIVDSHQGAWGNTSIGRIWFSDFGVIAPTKLERMPDAGAMALALLGDRDDSQGRSTESRLNEPLSGQLGRTVQIAPDATVHVDFIVAWHFPHAKAVIPGRSEEDHNRQYALDFADVDALLGYVLNNFDRLTAQTRLWRDTWYDSSLSHWFLNRTFANTSILATSTCFMFANKRFWADEGIGCCPGTCNHVWQYAQAPGRLFPEVERNHREFVDFGLALTDDGVIRFRAENGGQFAVDGQAGRILGVYREHQMTTDNAFLKRLWPATKLAIQRLMEADGDNDGIMHGPLHNTLDADWSGIVPWVNGMYHSALRAGEVMAAEVGDRDFARLCAVIRKTGMANLDKLCWNEDFGYYIQIGDPALATRIGSYDGCHIDQVYGQSWSYQLGLGEVITHDKARRCLESIWNYNFTPDVGPFRAVKTEGRWYAMAGDGGTIMLSHPFVQQRKFDGPGAWARLYFNECMSGFEHQLASHMMWEDMVPEGLAVTRAIHDRYHPLLRNPYNEVECSDHYSRAMASYGTFLAACGYEYDGPKQHLGFAPRMQADDFKAAFTSAESWGSFGQEIEGRKLTAVIDVHHGKLPLSTLALKHDGGDTVRVKQGDAVLPATLTRTGLRTLITFATPVLIPAGGKLEVTLS